MSQRRPRGVGADLKLANEGRRREPPFRLDLTVNPYGPSVHVQETLAAFDGLHLPTGWRADQLRENIARKDGVPSSWVVLTNGTRHALSLIYRWRRTEGPIIFFPPSDQDEAARASSFGIKALEIVRSPRFHLDLDLATLTDLPMGSAALVDSPSSMSGMIASTQDLVRIARTCEVLIIDEALTGYSPRSHLPLMREFDNVVLLRTFETWAGLAGLPIAYVVAPPHIASLLAGLARNDDLAAGPVVAALATLDDLPHIETSLARVRAEKARLYRTLRKLNVVSLPHPSWTNFFLARVERGNPAVIVDGLAERGILVHRPPHPGIGDHYVRISATFSEQTDALKRALIEIALDL